MTLHWALDSSFTVSCSHVPVMMAAVWWMYLAANIYRCYLSHGTDQELSLSVFNLRVKPIWKKTEWVVKTHLSSIINICHCCTHIHTNLVVTLKVRNDIHKNVLESLMGWRSIIYCCVGIIVIFVPDVCVYSRCCLCGQRYLQQNQLFKTGWCGQVLYYGYNVSIHRIECVC